ncbi:3-beta hydroxysteroid dehydrogenase/isomerase family-domain-containing protein [Cladochytrium replicatum]|nr:3-beta hydroxysteroid dehydrogenase/isomerase family-domain-containing protein [Cladochytrium replicatum]
MGIPTIVSALAAAFVAFFAFAYVLYLIFEAFYGLPPIPRNSRTYKGINTPINPVFPKDFDPEPTGSPKTYAVIGGGGFLGSYVVYRLLRTRKVSKIFVLDVAIGPNGWLYDGREEVEFVKVDITRREELVEALVGSSAEVVICTAAVVRYQDFLPSQYETSYKVNVEGTENVLHACDAAPSVKCLIYTSSAAVNVGWDIMGGKWWDLSEEEIPQAKKHFGHYGSTKLLAEQKVRSWKNRGYRSVALRPYGIYGYGDVSNVAFFLRPWGPYLNSILNWDYVENVAQALICAADVLKSNPEKLEGRMLHISDGLPVNSMELGRAFNVLRPEIANLFLLPRLAMFILCIFGDISHRLGIELPAQVNYLNLATFGFSQISPTYVNDAALEAIGDWRRWTIGESVGRCIQLWDLHRKKVRSERKDV